MTKHLLALSAAVALMGAPAAFAQTATTGAAASSSTATTGAAASAATPTPATDDAADADASSTAPAAPSLNNTPSTAAPMGAAPSAAAKVTAGLTVKDKTGAAIGTVTEVKPGPDGAELATVKMGTQTFSVASSSLGVSSGEVTINATAAEVRAMIKGAGS